MEVRELGIFSEGYAPTELSKIIYAVFPQIAHVSPSLNFRFVAIRFSAALPLIAGPIS